MAAQAASEAPQPSVAEKPLQPAPVEAIAEPVAPAPAAEAPEAVAPPEPVVSEQEFMQLAKKNNCLACHATGKKLVGPSFMDVAAKYRGDAGAEAWLIEKIAKGGKGVWGVMVMTPSPNIGEADRRRMAKYILSLK
jgi:cytochrome c